MNMIFQFLRVAFHRCGALAPVLLSVAVLSGCATVMHGNEGENVMVNTSGCPVETKCTLTNKKGSWQVEPPGSVSVHKSDDTLHVRCRTPAGEEVVGALDSEMTGTIFGNIIIGGGIGAIVDANTDAHRKYGDSITIRCRGG